MNRHPDSKISGDKITVAEAAVWNPNKATLKQCEAALNLMAGIDPRSGYSSIAVSDCGFIRNKGAIQIRSSNTRLIPLLFQLSGHVAPEKLLECGMDLQQGSYSSGEGGPIGAARRVSLTSSSVRGTLEVPNVSTLATAIGALAAIKGKSIELAELQSGMASAIKRT